MCVCLCDYIAFVYRRSKECNQSPEAEVTDGFELPDVETKLWSFGRTASALSQPSHLSSIRIFLILWVGMSKVEMEDGRWKGGYYITKVFKLTFPKYIDFFRYKIFEKKKYLERQRNSRRKWLPEIPHWNLTTINF